MSQPPRSIVKRKSVPAKRRSNAAKEFDLLLHGDRDLSQLEAQLFSVNWSDKVQFAEAVATIVRALDEPDNSVALLAFEATKIILGSVDAPPSAVHRLEQFAVPQPGLSKKVLEVLRSVPEMQRILDLTEITPSHTMPKPRPKQQPRTRQKLRIRGPQGSRRLKEKTVIAASRQQRLTLAQAAEELEVELATLRKWLASEPDEFPREDWQAGLRPAQITALRRTKVLADIYAQFDQPDAFLDTPNLEFGGDVPRDLLGTDREQLLFDYMMRINHGMVS